MALPTVLIVGAGFSGLAVAIRLHALSRTPLVVHLVDRSGVYGPGLAYSNRDFILTMGGLASRLSAFEEAPADFLSWLRSGEWTANLGYPVAAGADYYATRAAYGDYLKSIARSLRTASPNGVTVDIRQADVTDLERADDRFVASLADGTRLLADALVLAPGNLPPLDIAPELSAPLYLDSPWDIDSLVSIDRDEQVLIVGTGQSMLDVCVVLRHQAHRGHILAVSRRGLIAHVHATDEGQYQISLAELPRSLNALAAFVRRRVLDWQKRGGDWRAVINALRPHTQVLWSSLTDQEKRRFERHLRPYWQIHRTRVPPPVWHLVNNLRSSGQLKVLPGRVVDLARVGTQVAVEIRRRGAASTNRILVDRVINCTGPNQDYSRSKDSLISALLRRGLIRPDPSGRGVAVTPTGGLIDSEGQPCPNAFAVGSPCEGALLEITVVREIRRQAADVAARLLRAVGAEPTDAPDVEPPWIRSRG